MRIYRFVLGGIGTWAICCLFACRAVGGADAQNPQALVPRLFEEQVNAYCGEATASFEKRIQNLEDAGSPAEVQLISVVDPSAEESTACKLQTELAYAVAYYYDDPFIQEYYTVEKTGDTLIARIIPGKEDASDLQEQKILMTPDSSRILYIESRIEKLQSLFDLKVDIKVSFDASGRYAAHQLELYEHTAWLGTPFHVRIQGKGSLHE